MDIQQNSFVGSRKFFFLRVPIRASVPNDFKFQFENKKVIQK